MTTIHHNSSLFVTFDEARPALRQPPHAIHHFSSLFVTSPACDESAVPTRSDTFRHFSALLRRIAALFVALLTLTSCTRTAASPQQTPPPSPQTWTTGFWLWQGADTSLAIEGAPLDVLYVQAGSFRKTQATDPKSWYPFDTLPEKLPPARDYWLVYRIDGPDLPTSEALPTFLQSIKSSWDLARSRHWHIAGIQLDIDYPTRLLPDYARWLQQLRPQLPPGAGLSVTALLDWLKPGTGIQQVLATVDEYVPQFYDIQGRDQGAGGYSIATPIDGAKWNERLTPYGKRFRIGISSFGRTRLLRSSTQDRGGNEVVTTLKPLDFAINSGVTLTPARTAAQELQLTYRATRETDLGVFYGLSPGDAVQFTLATPESIRAAVAQAKLTGPYCAGVLFFRWPSPLETLATPPAEVLSAAGLRPSNSPPSQLRAVDARCAAVHCADLYLFLREPAAAPARQFRIQSKAPLSYFLPFEKAPVRLRSPRRLDVSLPPYTGRNRIYLGRAVAEQKNEYRLEEITP